MGICSQLTTSLFPSQLIFGTHRPAYVTYDQLQQIVCNQKCNHQRHLEFLSDHPLCQCLQYYDDCLNNQHKKMDLKLILVCTNCRVRVSKFVNRVIYALESVHCYAHVQKIQTYPSYLSRYPYFGKSCFHPLKIKFHILIIAKLTRI